MRNDPPDSVLGRDGIDRSVSDLEAAIPTLPRWNSVRQIGPDISAHPGDMVIYDPNDGNVRAFLARALAEHVGKEIMFARASNSTATYTVFANPGDTIDGLPELVSAEWRGVMVLVCVAAGLWSWVSVGKGVA